MPGRTIAAILCLSALALTACDDGPARDASGLSAAIDNANPPVQCAPAGARTFRPDCTLQRTGTKNAWLMTNPDGSFHRLERGDSPSGYVTVAGADRGASDFVGDYIVMTIGRDRYRWPAPKSTNAR